MGINLAIQDAVAAANLLAEPLCGTEAIPEELLAKVQRRRMFPTRATQRMQIFIQEHVIRRVLESDAPVAAPRALRLLKALPWLQRIPARGGRRRISGGACALALLHPAAKGSVTDLPADD